MPILLIVVIALASKANFELSLQSKSGS